MLVGVRNLAQQRDCRVCLFLKYGQVPNQVLTWLVTEPDISLFNISFNIIPRSLFRTSVFPHPRRTVWVYITVRQHLVCCSRSTQPFLVLLLLRLVPVVGPSEHRKGH